MKLEDALKRYVAEITVNEGKSPRTIASYKSDLQQYIAFLSDEGIKDTKKVTGDIIEDFMIDQSM